MRFFKKFNIIIIISLSLVVVNMFTFPDENKILIKDVLINKNIDSYFVSFDQEIQLRLFDNRSELIKAFH